MSNHLGELSVENKNYDLYSSSQLGTPGNCKSNNYIGGVLVFFFFRLQSLVINIAIHPTGRRELANGEGTRMFFFIGAMPPPPSFVSVDH
jgi:hypothetical protein